MGIFPYAIAAIGFVYLSVLCLIGAAAFILGGIGMLVAETLFLFRWL